LDKTPRHYMHLQISSTKPEMDTSLGLINEVTTKMTIGSSGNLGKS